MKILMEQKKLTTKTYNSLISTICYAIQYSVRSPVNFTAATMKVPKLRLLKRSKIFGNPKLLTNSFAHDALKK